MGPWDSLVGEACQKSTLMYTGIYLFGGPNPRDVYISFGIFFVFNFFVIAIMGLTMGHYPKKLVFCHVTGAGLAASQFFSAC